MRTLTRYAPLLLVLLAAPVLAQEPTPGAAAAVDPTDIGVIGVMAALIGFLTQATKWGVFASLVPAWLRPFIALGLGVCGGILDQVIRGESWSKAILGGIVAAATAVFGNQLAGSSTPGGRAKKEAASIVSHAMAGPEAEANATLAAIGAERSAIAAMPDKTARLQKLAEVATRASNGAR